MEQSLNTKDNGTADQREAVEVRVLQIVSALAHELHPRRQARATPTSLLQRDLGFDSLGLAELLLRTEKEFHLRLPDDVITRLETPSDLTDEVMRSSSGAESITARSAATPSEAAFAALPDAETTLTGVLDWHAEHNRERPHIILSDGYVETETITYRDLRDSSARLAASFRAQGVEPGEFVCIMLPTGRTFFEAFFAALYCGAVPVPMYPPMRLSQLEEHLRRQAGILRNSQASLLIVPPEGKTIATILGAQIDSLRKVATVEELRQADGDGLALACHGDELAMLQYTSGSTGDPKGVMLSHANLLSNIRAMGQAVAASDKDVFISWLPLYHDLGLIGAWFATLYHAVPTVIMSPLRFIVRPESWLWAIHRNGGTLSAAPNFAFEFCVNRIPDEALEGLDLSSLRMVANGAEPISAETMHRFAERFAPYGFNPEAMTPVYGLAENSVGLAFSPMGVEPLVEHISRTSLSENGVAEKTAADDPHAMTFISSGVPLAGHEIRIVDTFGHEVPERHQGRLEFKGPSSTTGYYRQPEKTASLFRDGWLDSGDVAYIASGNVFITGRVKDIIIKGGRNIYPSEIEEAVGELDDIRKGCVVAFASNDERTGSERLVVVAESRKSEPDEVSRLEQNVLETVTDVLGMPADQVVIVAPHAVPKTSSGKIRRSMARELFETGKMGQPVRALWLQVVRLNLMAALPFGRRVARSVKAFAYAGWWWAVLVSIAAIVWSGVLIVPKRKWRWAFVHSAARTALRLMGIKLTIEGADRLLQDAGVVTVNHSSYLDSLVLAATLPGEPVFVAKHDLSRQFVAGPFLRRLGARFAERETAEAGVKEAETFGKLVRDGERLVIFPEATLTRMPGLLPFRLGAFAIACATQSPVLPIVLTGTRSVLRGGQWFPRHGAVSVEVLDTLLPEGQDFAATLKLRDMVRARILERCGEPDMAEHTVTFAKGGNEQFDG